MDELFSPTQRIQQHPKRRRIKRTSGHVGRDCRFRKLDAVLQNVVEPDATAERRKVLIHVVPWEAFRGNVLDGADGTLGMSLPVLGEGRARQEGQALLAQEAGWVEVMQCP